MTDTETAGAIALCQTIEGSIDRMQAHLTEMHAIFDRIDIHMAAFEAMQDARA